MNLMNDDIDAIDAYLDYSLSSEASDMLIMMQRKLRAEERGANVVVDDETREFARRLAIPAEKDNCIRYVQSYTKWALGKTTKPAHYEKEVR